MNTIQVIRSKKKLLLISLIIILVLASASIALSYNLKKDFSTNQQATQNTVEAAKGNLSVTVSGSGALVSSNRKEISSKVEATVTAVHFEEGDEVKEGDLLIEFDDYSQLETVEKIKTNLSIAQLDQKTNRENLENLTIRAPFSGEVSDIQFKEGDKVNSNTTIFTLTDNSKLKVLLPFNSTSIKDASVGMEAIVHVQDLMESVKGTISYISNKAYSTSLGGNLYNVEITIDNPGSLKEGMSVSGEISTPDGSQFSLENRELEYIDTIEYTSETGGTVQQINIMENQYVEANEVLMVLENTDLISTIESKDITISEYETQLENAEKDLEYYTIYAPFDGTIVSQDLAVGDYIDSGTTITTIANNDEMEFEIDVDELDIEKIAVDQKVIITVDAIESTSTTPIEGVVSKIAIEGTSSSGVATYPVTVSLENNVGLRGGMYASAEIYVLDVEDALLIPIEAIEMSNNKTYVWVKGSDSDTDAENNSEEANKSGAVRTEIEVGESNDTYIEVLSGLNEGDEVVVQSTSTGASSTDDEKEEQGMPGMGMNMGGGGPEGGGPGGGPRG